jgi:AraC-like DNA-binding protein
MTSELCIFKKIEYYLLNFINIVLIFFIVFDLLIKMYLWMCFLIVLLLVNILTTYAILESNIAKSTNILSIYFTVIESMSLILFVDIFPIHYLIYIPLLLYVIANQSLVYCILYCSFLIIYLYFVRDISYYFRTKILDIYYVPTNDVLLVNNIFVIIVIIIVSIMLYFYWEKKKELGIKNWHDFVIKNDYLKKRKAIDYMMSDNLFQVFENELEELYFKIKSFLENQKPYKNPDYNINNISKELGESNAKIIKAFEYQYDKINFDDLLNYYRIKEAKKLLLTNELILEDIYSIVGFKNYKKFVTTFTYFEGISPETYIHLK